MSTWLLLGSSPSVTDTLFRAREENPVDYTITCNSGIELDPNPTVYLCVDPKASTVYEVDARRAQSNGTRLVTIKREKLSMAGTKTDFYDEFLDLPEKYDDFNGISMTKYRYSGPTCIQYAIVRGATKVVIVGCDGYTGHNDYFNGKLPGYNRVSPEWRTENILKLGLNNIAAVCRKVQFIQYGKPLYRIDLPNWEVR